MPSDKKLPNSAGPHLNSVKHVRNARDHGINSAHHAKVPLWQKYARGHIACHLHLGVYVRSVGHTHYLCADFQAADGLRGVMLHADGVRQEEERIPLEHTRSPQHWVERLVFVPVRESLQDSEGLLSGVRSLVGLRVLDRCPARRRDFAEQFPLVREPLAGVLNRELHAFVHPLGFGDPEVAATERPKEVIEGARGLGHRTG